MIGNEKNVPRRRFKEFQNTEAWEQRKVGNMGNVVTGSTPATSDSTNYGEEYLFVSPADIQGNRYIKSTITKLSRNGFDKCRILKEGSTLFVSIGSTIGKVAQIKEMATTNQQINSIEPSEKYDDNFIYSVMEYKAKGIRELAATQAVPIVNKTTFSQVNLMIPTVITEQIKIGDYFKKLDNLITLHQHKLDKMKALKKAYLKDMFPQEGESNPKLRFVGFTDDWEQRKLGEVADIVRGASPRPIQDSKWFDNENSEIGWLRISDVTEQNGRIHFLEQRISKEGQEKTRVLLEPHLLLSIAATVGKPVINYVKTGVHDGFLIFLNPKFDREYMFQCLEMFRPQWQQFGQPGSQVNLNSEIVRNVEICIPTFKEQQKIGNFFTNLDNLITLHQRKLEKLKNIKKAYLNEMFI